MTHLQDEGKACTVSVSNDGTSSTTSSDSGGPPPLDVDAVRQARQWLDDPEPYDAETGGREVVRRLLGAYDALAARLAWLAAGGE
jgi:hypothetical protein